MSYFVTFATTVLFLLGTFASFCDDDEVKKGGVALLIISGTVYLALVSRLLP